VITPVTSGFSGRFFVDMRQKKMDAVQISNLTKYAHRFAPQEGASWLTPQHAQQALARMGAVQAYSDEMQPHSAVMNIALEVQEGEIFGLLGDRGAGKTTLLYLIAAELQPDEGFIKVFGWDTVRQAALVSRLVNTVRLEKSMLERLSPKENLVYSARLAGVHSSEMCRNTVELLSMLGVEPQMMDVPLEHLLQPVRRQLALALALQSPARLLLLDDPFRDLDPCERQQAWLAVQRCSHQTGRTIIVATREPGDVLATCQRVAVLEQGRLINVGAPDEVLPTGIDLGEDCYALAV
jgi:ABC-2 type transport system ATP-binding protein